MGLSCPACQHSLQRSQTYCPNCHFGFYLLENYYREEENPTLRLLTDRAGVLTAIERKKLKRTIIHFCQRFPGVYFSVVFDVLENREEVDSKGLWLFNVADFIDLPEGLNPENGLFLYIDVQKQEMALSFGERLARILTNEQAHTLTSAGYHSFLKGRYLIGAQKIIKETGKHIARKCHFFSKSS